MWLRYEYIKKNFGGIHSHNVMYSNITAQKIARICVMCSVRASVCARAHQGTDAVRLREERLAEYAWGV